MSLTPKNPKNLWKRYIIAILLVFVLVTSSHLVALKASSSGEELAAAVNISGRQRMLSQRILFFASEALRDEQEDPTIDENLSNAINLFESSHKALTKGGALGLSGTLSANLQQLYFGDGSGPALDQQVADFIRSARVVLEGSPDAASAYARMRIVGPAPLLAALNEAVSGWEDMARDSVQSTRRIATFTYWLAVLVLIMEGLAIFYPAHKSIVRYFNELEETTKQLGVSKKRAEESAKEADKARQIAEDAAQSKAMFLANMSHEIRTPLNAIVGFSGLALRTTLTEQQKDYVSKIESSSNVLLSLINDILDMSKIDADQIELEHIEFQLDDVLAATSTVLAGRALDKNLELLFQTDPDLPPVLVGDPLRLGQILTNLAGNAIKFTDKGEVIVRIMADQISDDAIKIKGTVQDTGMGMTPDQVEKLFTPFTQADASMSRKFGGTGLGLTITKRLVELMDGDIAVESEKDIGTTFTFSAIFGPVKGDVPKRQLAPADLRGSRVLLVDDNAMALQILQETLESLQLKVTAMPSGADAIEELARAAKADEEPYRIALIDWKMPGMNGIETTKEIAKLAKNSPMPQVLMLTAFTMGEARKDAERAGAVGFMTKPINQSVLYDKITETLLTDDDTAENPASDDPAQSAKAVLEGANLLVAEDNPLNRQVITEILSQAGITFDLVENGLEAVKSITTKGDTYDAVLMDLQMPEMDGYEATQKIRAMKQFADLPIIALTAHAMAGDRARSIAAGMNDHVTKPLDPERVFATLSEFIGQPKKSKSTPGETADDQSLGTQGTSKASDQHANRAPDALPEDIPGLDIDIGLRTLMGNRISYRTLLIGFVDQFGNASTELADLVAAGDREALARFIHSLKGVAGNLGVTKLYESAQIVEPLLKANDLPSDAPEMMRLKMAIDEIIPALKDFFEG